MQAVIMAGGKGTRLASVTGDLPKPMVPAAGKPLLAYQVENLKNCGIRDIVLIIGYRGEKIREYFGNGDQFGVSISYFEEKEPLGSAGALGELKDALEDTFILLFGDLMINVDFSGMLEYHRAKKASITLFAHPNSHPYDSDLVLCDPSGRVTGFLPKSRPREEYYNNLVNAGIYVLDRRVLQDLPVHQKLDMEKDVVIPKIQKERIFAYRSTEYVKDLGTPERLSQVEKDLESGLPQKRNRRNPQKCIFLDRDGTLNRYAGYVRDPSELVLEPCAARAVRLINGSEYLAIVITNQPVIARGVCTLEGLERIHKKLYTLLGQEGAYLDALYYCPHHPDRGFPGERPEYKIDCDCRKPKPGLVYRARDDFHISLADSWFVGDTRVDVETGKNAGTHTVLLCSGDPDPRRKEGGQPDFRAENLLEAVRKILGNG